MSDALTTIRDFIRWAITEFNKAGAYFGHGTDNAWDEATYLVLSTLKLPLGVEQVLYDAVLTEEERALIIERVRRRTDERIPLAYLLGEAYFAGLRFNVTPSVLVPRSPLGEWIRNLGQPWLDAENVEHVLDIGTGSGCIAIACAYHFPIAHVDAVDISPEALEVAKSNVGEYGLEAQVSLLESDCFTEINDKKYDLIISNPPYVDVEDLEMMPEEFHHEPILGLAAGQDGLDIARRILAEAKDYLKEEGMLIMEVGNSQYALQAEFSEVPFLWLDFEHGGDGVLLLTRAQLEEHAEVFAKSLPR